MQLIRRTLLPLFISLALLAGCAAPLVEPERPAYESDPVFVQATALEAMGDFAAAGAMLEQFAANQESPSREALLLHAATAFLRAGDIDRSRDLLAAVDLTDTPQLWFERRLLEAEIALAEKRFDEALMILDVPPPERTPDEQLKRYYANRGDALYLTGKPLESAFALTELDLLTRDLEEKLKVQLTLLERLTTLTDTALELLQPEPPGIQGGWMELARITKTYAGDTEALPTLLLDWRERFPSHPALPELIDAYREELSRRFSRPERLAVLLPASGPIAQPAAALWAGFLAAYYQEPPENRPAITFYDNSDTAQTWPLYRRAVDEGANIVIGPLDKEGVAQLLRAGDLEIPVLALNQVPPETVPPLNLYQFGLSPEDEARQVAERAWLDGHRHALALIPEGPWGDRVFAAFRDRWEQLGGILGERQIYAPAENDFSAPIRALLNIDESDLRRSRLEGLLGRKVEFEPRRRQDADFIFLLAKNQEGRQIRPQLQFHHAAGVPVYATSHIFSGRADPKGDQDLEGVVFPDIPWVLLDATDDPLSRHRLAELLPESQNSFQRLYAMGIDSYRLIYHLYRLQSSTTESLDGRTGILSMNEVNQMHRQLVWAEMQGGMPRVLGYADRLDQWPMPVVPGQPLDTGNAPSLTEPPVKP